MEQRAYHGRLQSFVHNPRLVLGSPEVLSRITNYFPLCCACAARRGVTLWQAVVNSRMDCNEGRAHNFPLDARTNARRPSAKPLSDLSLVRPRVAS